jgi:hypothetical protein
MKDNGFLKQCVTFLQRNFNIKCLLALMKTLANSISENSFQLSDALQWLPLVVSNAACDPENCPGSRL